MKKYIIQRAILEAQKSTFKPRHGCIIFKGSRIISTGYNEIRYCSRLNKKDTRWESSLHAECKTILYTEQDIKRCSILVVRLNNYNQLMYSKPCPLCMNLIKKVGIKNVYYSTSLGTIERI